MPEKANNKRVVYELKKITHAVAKCGDCDGTGEIHAPVHHNKTYTYKCALCLGEGERYQAIETPVLLTEALNALGVTMKIDSK